MCVLVTLLLLLLLLLLSLLSLLLFTTTTANTTINSNWIGLDQYIQIQNPKSKIQEQEQQEREQYELRTLQPKETTRKNAQANEETDFINTTLLHQVEDEGMDICI